MAFSAGVVARSGDFLSVYRPGRGLSHVSMRHRDIFAPRILELGEDTNTAKIQMAQAEGWVELFWKERSSCFRDANSLRVLG